MTAAASELGASKPGRQADKPILEHGPSLLSMRQRFNLLLLLLQRTSQKLLRCVPFTNGPEDSQSNDLGKWFFLPKFRRWSERAMTFGQGQRRGPCALTAVYCSS